MDMKQIRLPAILLIIFAIVFFYILTHSVAISRSITVKAKTASGAVKEIRLYSGYYALLVGCGDYQKRWPRLPNPVRDAQEVASTLKGLGWNCV